LEWASHNGAAFFKIEIKHYSKNFRGVHSTTDISPNERIVTIPFKMILSAGGCKNSVLGKKIKDSGVSISYPYCTYIACLLLDASKDPGHFYRPYFDIFPTDASTFPFFYTNQDLATLQELSIASTFYSS
jgi:hypothetical protein